MNGIQAASDFKFFSDYSKYREDLGRTESWVESVERVMDMHMKKYQGIMTPELSKLMDFAKNSYEEKLVLGSQRALQFGGEPMLKKNARMYNCLSGYVDRVSFFQEAMYFLLCGCGVGFSVQKHHIEKLPSIQARNKGVKTFIIPDSIEGWSDAFGVLISSFVTDGATFPEYQGYRIDFDYSLIRPKGSLIAGGFKAPGHEGLRNSIQKVQDLLCSDISSKSVNIRPIIAYDFVMHMSDAVLSGGVRRSATICLFTKDDEDMLTAKTGNWFETNPQRGRSNNSAILVRDDIERSDFDKIMESVKERGEPGFIFAENNDITYNPCVTGDTWVMTEKGPRQTIDILNDKLNVIVDGKLYNSSTGMVFTGNKEVFELELFSGHKIKATSNHKIKTNSGWVELGNLCVGDEVILNNHTNISWDGNGTFKQGWLLGEMVGDGGVGNNYDAYVRFWGESQQQMAETAVKYINEELGRKKNATIGKSSKHNKCITVGSVPLTKLTKEFSLFNKEIGKPVEEASSEFYKGFIRGMFDADGTVIHDMAKGSSIRLTQSSLPRLEAVQRMLSRLGVNSTIYNNRYIEGYREMPDGKGGSKKYLCAATHELSISNDSIIKFADRIGFNEPQKNIRLTHLIKSYKRVPNKDKFYSKVISITPKGIEDVYDITVDYVHEFDGNGISVHNCVEIGMYPQTEKGISGFQGCNLTEINGGACYSEQLFYDACKASAILGTLQAGYTDIGYVSKETIQIFEREALLGCSITGWMNNPDVLFDEKILQKGARIVKKWNKIMADLIGINQAARTTCVKPSGNASVLLGCASGIHGEHSKRYFRNAQVNKENDIGNYYAEFNSEAVEESVWSTNGTDNVISFPIEASDNTIFKKDLLGVKQLEYVRIAQQNWVEFGTNEELCVMPSCRHNVSNTIQVNDWKEIADYLFNNKDWLAGVSLLPMSGDKDYAQAPFTEVLSAQEILGKYGDASILASGLVVDALHAFNNNLWDACACALDKSIPINGHDALQKKDWIRRCEQFADRYMDNEILIATYCLKDVYNFHKWLKVTRDRVDVPWESLDLKPEYIDIDTLSGAACAGGTCEMPI